MKVAIVFNEAAPEIYNNLKENLKKVNFEANFDLETPDPILEFNYMHKALIQEGYDAYLLNIKDDFLTFIKDYEKNKPDVVFNLVELYKDQPKFEMNFTGLLELMGVAYTGASPMALATCQNKTLTKRIINTLGIKTPKFKFIKSMDQSFRVELNYPLIVKPAFEDASVGIDNNSIVNNVDELKKRVEYIFNSLQQPSLVEEFIEGRELNVAVFGDKDLKVLPISEIDFSEMPKNLYPIVSFQAKWDPFHEAYHKTIPICPAQLPKEIEEEAKEIAIKCFKAVGVRDYARVDMRLSSKDNQLYVLEVNPNPDLQEGAGFMRSAHYAGYSYSKMLSMIVELAYQRKSEIDKRFRN
ncbi:D-alanine--D-alanine ligase family protein [Stygiobacter electus]|uniref:ATP-grasp domain-containing protein n=1 Tax=Stygiobacter electus TaxID=3032292 RepID=A0AAE3NXL0_9BACT|nr:ATP-grasp domain-containing protein [Stygiobacter electus]MDF1611931.1 ATP-grasp domain-containing protein [Stygiobacter electus]